MLESRYIQQAIDDELMAWRVNYHNGMPVLSMLDREIEVETRNDRIVRAKILRRLYRAMLRYIDNSDR